MAVSGYPGKGPNTGRPKGSKNGGPKKKRRTATGRPTGSPPKQAEMVRSILDQNPDYVRECIKGGYTPNHWGSNYRPEYAEQVGKAVAAGYNMYEVGRLFGVAQRTIETWRVSYPEFNQAWLDAKADMVNGVARSLLHRANGWSHATTKVFNDKGTIITHKMMEYYPGDVNAQQFILCNQDSENWKQVSRVEKSGPGGGPIQVEQGTKLTFDPAELEAALKIVGAK